MKKEKIITTKQLCKTFSNGGVQQHVLKNLNVEIYSGDYTVIMGASGAGKTTLMYSMSGMDRPTLGEIYFGEEEISKYSDDQLSKFRREHCGFVFQQMYLIDKMSVMDNVLASGLLVNNQKEQVMKTACELFEQVNITPELQKKFPSQLSGGEQQRVAIVRGLINHPQVLFADEPTGALNSAQSTAVLDVLTTFNEGGQSMIMVTHDIKSALRGNRILYLRDGVVCGECNLEKYSQSENNERREKLNTFLTEMGW